MEAFLEKILLDDSGKIKPQYDDTKEPSTGFRGHQADQSDLAPLDQREQVACDTEASYYQPSEHPAEVRTDQRDVEPELPTANALKRKLSYAHAESSLLDLEETNISQYLPDRSILSKISDFFCVSFHHWIPYIHKQRLQTRVRDGTHSAGFDLVLHALVAVALRHMDVRSLCLHESAAKEQMRISRLIVETNATRMLSVESLQAIILIVFDHVGSRPLMTSQSNLV